MLVGEDVSAALVFFFPFDPKFLCIGHEQMRKNEVKVLGFNVDVNVNKIARIRATAMGVPHISTSKNLTKRSP